MPITFCIDPTLIIDIFKPILHILLTIINVHIVPNVQNLLRGSILNILP